MAQSGAILTRHADIRKAMENANLGNVRLRLSALAAKNADRYLAADLARNIPPFLDKPAHTSIRQAIGRAFYDTFKPFEAILPDLATETVTAAPATGDLVQRVSAPFTLRAMSRFVGVAG